MSQQVFTNRYEIVRHVARGGMAEVYLARDLQLDRPVALKVLFPELSADPAFVQRFRREAQAAANLNHPNIVSVYDWGEEDSTYFIVMEYVEGSTLRELLRREGKLHAERAADIGADIAAALHFAHRNGVIHRDVKPGNVLITASGQVKVTDFGIARAARDAAGENLTQTGTVMGTATYFSPEQAQGLPVDPRSDVYALGVVLYEVLTGRPPFSGDNPVAIAYQHVREQPQSPRSLNADIPPALEAVVLKALAKEPDNRYASANDLRDDLLRFRQGQAVAAAAVVAAPAVGSDTTQVQRSYDDSTRMAPAATGTTIIATDPPIAGRRTATYLILAVVLLALLGVLIWLLYREFGRDGSSATVKVPNVITKPVTEAERTLVDAGLKPVRQESNNADVPAGTVFGQDPTNGTRVKKGDEVRLQVSAGATEVPVGNVIGLPVDEARDKLEGAGFQVTVRSRADDTRAKDTVIDQRPREGTKLPGGGTVALTVSTGKPAVAVPDVKSQTSDPTEAANILGRAGFTTALVRQASDSVADGEVIGTDPAAGAQAEKGAKVNVLVSSGPQATGVPNVVSLDRTAAAAQLERAGFQFDLAPDNDPARCTADADGTVTRQSPRAGVTAAPGSTVTITVCTFTGSTDTTTTTTEVP